MVKALVFDFDGVIVDSNRVKRDAWFSIFESSEEVSRALVEDALQHTAGDRFDILRYIFSKPGYEPGQVALLVDEYAHRYDTEVKKGIFGVGVSRSVFDTLRQLKEKYKLYINSATPEEALEETVKRLELDTLFESILGTPSSKEENLKKVMERENVASTELIFIGDGEGDRDAAVSIGCQFIGIANEWNEWKGESFRTVNEFSELPTVISQTNHV